MEYWMHCVHIVRKSEREESGLRPRSSIGGGTGERGGLGGLGGLGGPIGGAPGNAKGGGSAGPPEGAGICGTG
jgi:hypothetical protein